MPPMEEACSGGGMHNSYAVVDDVVVALLPRS